MKKLLVALIVAAALCAGCSSEQSNATTQTSQTTIAPVDKPYATAEELAAGLTSSGITCGPVVPGTSYGSSTGSCDALHLTVWPTPEGAARGIEATVNADRTLNRISTEIGSPTTAYYLISKANWLIDTQNESAATAVQTRFGGQFQVID